MFTPPAYLSPSSINTFVQCPLKFKINKFDNIKEPPSWATHLGSFTHEVLEHLYQLDPEDRTLDAVKSLASELWAANDWEQQVLALAEPQGDIRQFKIAAFNNMKNLWELEDPTETELDGMEEEVDALVEGVAMKGRIDRYIVADDGSLIISDYKTGKVPNPRFNDQNKQFFQLLAYAAMLKESAHLETSKLELLYLTASTKHSLDVTPVTLSTAKRTIVETKESLDASCSSGNFTANVSKLCDWCHFKKIGVCPAHK